ncbi:MAG: hypothetical protein NVS3B5_06780 [Sphingomicrobium sp.]
MALSGSVSEPRSPQEARPGLWDVSLSATGNGARRYCLADPMVLSQWEHRGGACTRIILAEHDASLTVHYTCAGRGFGQSVLTLITPRSIKVDTQGISGDGPFAYRLYARRAGNCAPR